MNGAYAPFRPPRPSTSLGGGNKSYKNRSTSILSPAPAADRHNSSQQPTSVPSSSFHGTPSTSSQGGARRNVPYGPGGDGFDDIVDTYGLDLFVGSSSSSTCKPARSSYARAEQRPPAVQQPPRPVQSRSAAPAGAYPWDDPVEVTRVDETGRAGELRRKQQQEAEEADAEEERRKFDEADRLDRLRREAITAARRKSAAAAAAPSIDPPKPRYKTSVEILFEDQKARPKPEVKNKREEELERAKERRSRGKDKGKKRVVALESDIEDSADDRSPRDKPHSAPATSTKLGGLRGHFDSTAPTAPSPSRSPSPEVVAEVLPSLEDMLREEQAAERKRRKGKGRARDDDDKSERVETVREKADEALHYDALLDEDEDDLPDSSTLCPFCDRPLPDTPSPQLLATRAALLRHPHDRRPTLRNKDAVRFPEGEHVVRTAAFCKMHVDERTVVPEGRAKGYPTTIKWDELPRRIDRQLGNHLSDVVFDEKTSPFLDRALRAWDAGEWKSVLSEYGSFDVEEPGYYGPRGLEIIKHTLSALFVDTAPIITPRRTARSRSTFTSAASSYPTEERREAARAPSQAVVVLNEVDGAQERSATRRSRDERGRERDEARPAKKRRRVVSSSESSGGESDGIEVVERAPARVPKVVAAAADRAPAAGGAFRVPKAQGQARSAAASTSSSSTSSSAPASAAASAGAPGGRKQAALQVDSDSDDELLIVTPAPLPSSPSKKDKKKKKREKEHKGKDRDHDKERKKHKKARRSSPASSPALGLLPPSSSLPSSSLALDTSPPGRETELARLAAALDPSVEDDLAEVDFKAGSFARENRKRDAREKQERREKRKRERARKKERRGRASSSSSSDEA
ncbi:hypothetical protein JCM8208_001987 [Rhodotorula glutinis]